MLNHKVSMRPECVGTWRSSIPTLSCPTDPLEQEFFAEMSVTYLSNGYRKLDKADKAVMESCCPPLIEPNVTDRFLRKYGVGDPIDRDGHCCKLLASQPSPKMRIVNPELQETALQRSCLGLHHCNKFYPFTRGQLKHHDHVVYEAMKDLWHEITLWDDEEDDRVCTKYLSCLWRSCR